jgi:hypothetical protein
MKPTTGRLPVYGWHATMGGAEQIVPTIGPLSTSLEVHQLSCPGYSERATDTIRRVASCSSRPS